MNNKTENFKMGQDLFYKGLRYTQINKELGGTVHADVYRGWDEANSLTRCGYLNQVWNKTSNYKTSSDITTLFT